MRSVSLVTGWAACMHLVLVSVPARAQQAPVQPVPYSTSQPVPYGAAPTTPPPPAQPPTYTAPTAVGAGGDTVVLKNGGMIRGTLIELLPNDHATIQMPNGQSAIVQWAEIHHIERAAGPAPTPVSPTAPQPLPSSPPPKPPSGPLILVHVEASRRVSLMRREPDNGEWITACESPCDQQLPLNNEYRLAGSGVTQSGEFELEGKPGQRVVITANVGSTAGLTGGLIVAGVGLLVTIVGLEVLATAAAVNNIDCATTTTSTGSCSSKSGGVGVGLVITLGGVAAMAIGGIIAIINWKTGQTQELQVPKGTARASLDRPRDDRTWARSPTWNAPTPAALGAPRTTEIPLFSRSF